MTLPNADQADIYAFLLSIRTLTIALVQAGLATDAV